MQAIPPRTAANLTDRPATLRPMFDTLSEKLQSALDVIEISRRELENRAFAKADESLFFIDRCNWKA